MRYSHYCSGLEPNLKYLQGIPIMGQWDDSGWFLFKNLFGAVSSCGPLDLLFRHTDFSLVVAHRLSSSLASGIFPDQGSNLSPLSSWPIDLSCIGRKILYHWAAREAHKQLWTLIFVIVKDWLIARDYLATITRITKELTRTCNFLFTCPQLHLDYKVHLDGPVFIFSLMFSRYY